MVYPYENLKTFPDYSETEADTAELSTDEMLPLVKLGERHKLGRSKIWGSPDEDINVARK